MTSPRSQPAARLVWLAALGFLAPALGLGIALFVSLDRRRDVESQKRAFERDRAAAALRVAVDRELDAARVGRDRPRVDVVRDAERFWPSPPGDAPIRVRDGAVLPFELDATWSISERDLWLAEMPHYAAARRAERQGEHGGAALLFRRALESCGPDAARRDGIRVALATATLRSGDTDGALDVLAGFDDVPADAHTALAVDALRAEAHERAGAADAAAAARARNRARLERDDLGLGYLDTVLARERYASLPPPAALHAFYRRLADAARHWANAPSEPVVVPIGGATCALLLGDRVDDAIGGRAVRIVAVDAVVDRAVRVSRIEADFARVEAAGDLAVPLPGLGRTLHLADRHPVAASIWQDRDALMMLGLGALAIVVLAVAAFATLRAASRLAHLSALRADFISSVSHELKTPLTSIRLFTDLLRAGRVTDAERVANYHRLIGEEAEKLSHVVGNVLDASRLEAGRRRFVPETIDLSALVRDTVASFAGRADALGVEIDTRDVNGAVPVDADRDAVERVVSNLIDNALKYGAGPLELATAADGAFATLRVSDHGSGIPAAERARLVRRFERGDHHGPGTPAGSGLGLALVTDILAAHGGALTIDDTPGGGATLVATLARKDAE